MDMHIEIKSRVVNNNLINQFEVRDDKLANWIVLLASLAHGVVSGISIGTEKASIRMEVDKKLITPANTSGRVKIEDNMVYLWLTINELNAWLDFYLHKFHEGYEDFIHLDIQIYNVDSKNINNYYITIK